MPGEDLYRKPPSTKAGYRLSKEEVVEEIFKCGKEPVHFMNNYVRISHPLKGLISFRMFDYQKTLGQDFVDFRFNIVLKARQLGISTLVAAYACWLMLFHRNKSIMIVATKYETAANLVRKVRMMIKHIPPWLRIANISVDNRTSIELSNGSMIKASTTSEDAGRSEALSLLIIDEAAFINGLEDLWKGIYPTLSTGGRCIAISTPSGAQGWFHKQYMAAIEGKSDFHATKLMWNVHPERDEKWFLKETQNMTKRDIAQELLCSFNMSGAGVFEAEDMKWLESKIKSPKYKTAFDRNLWMWEDYKSAFSYVIAADVARGDGQDYSAFHVFKLQTMEIVAEYQGKLAPDAFADLLYTTGYEYGKCMIVVENANVGFAVLDKLIDQEYPNLYYSAKGSHDFVEQYEAEGATNVVPGFTTSTKTRPLIVAKFEEFVRNKIVTIYSNRLINEMRTFVWENGKPAAARGYNDDLIMACSIGCWIRDTVLSGNLRDLEYKKAFLGCMKKTNTVFETSIPGMNGCSTSPGQRRAEEEIKKYGWAFGILKG